MHIFDEVNHKAKHRYYTVKHKNGTFELRHGTSAVTFVYNEDNKSGIVTILFLLFFHFIIDNLFRQPICYLLTIYNTDDMKSKNSGNNNTKKNVMKVHKKTSISKRPRDIGKIGRTPKTRQQRISKTKPSKRKKQQQEQQIVIKRSSGRKEKFDTNRMAQTVGRSGVPFLMARDVAKKVSNKIKDEAYAQQQQTKGRSSSNNKSKPTQPKEKTVTASRVRNLVASELRDRNRSDIAVSYSGQVPENTLEEQNLKDKQPIADTVATNRNRVLHDTSKRGGGIMT